MIILYLYAFEKVRISVIRLKRYIMLISQMIRADFFLTDFSSTRDGPFRSRADVK